MSRANFRLYASVLQRWKTISWVLTLELILIGCSTPPNPTPTSDAELTARLMSIATAHTPAPPPAVEATRPLTNAPLAETPPVPTIPAAPTASVVTNPPTPPAQSARPPAWPKNSWVAWQDWSQANGWGKPERLRNTGAWSFALRGSPGVVEISAGKRTALWNNLSLELGFAPRLTNGQPYLHALDLVKTLDPLTLQLPLLSRPQRTVVIDPGHGGENYGARSALAERYEKEFALDWAVRVERLLKDRGWRVHLTRTTDVDIALSNRVAFADGVKADVFISLHFNSTDQPQGQTEQGGIETYCLTPAGMPSTVTRRYNDEANQAFPNNAYDVENYCLATRLHRALVEGTKGRDRGVRRARFMGILRGQTRPAVLLEGGYLTNPAEARLIATSEYRQKLALAVANALSP